MISNVFSPESNIKWEYKYYEIILIMSLIAQYTNDQPWGRH